MRYRRPHKKESLRRLYTALVIVLLFVLFFFTQTGVPNGIVRIVHFIGVPFWKTQPVVAHEAQGILSLFKSKGALITENMKLKEQYQEAQKELIDHTLLKQEHRELTEIVNRIPDRSFTLAGVLLKPDASPYDTLVIDIGAAHQLSVGDSVFATDRTYIGIVDEVYVNSARVRLLSSPGFETTVVLNTSNIQQTAVGKGGGNLVIDTPKDVAVSVGEHVLLPGLPQSLVGTVNAIASHPADAIKTLYVTMPVNVYTLTEVFIEV